MILWGMTNHKTVIKSMYIDEISFKSDYPYTPKNWLI